MLSWCYSSFFLRGFLYLRLKLIVLFPPILSLEGYEYGWLKLIMLFPPILSLEGYEYGVSAIFPLRL